MASSLFLRRVLRILCTSREGTFCMLSESSPSWSFGRVVFSFFESRMVPLRQGSCVTWGTMDIGSISLLKAASSHSFFLVLCSAAFLTQTVQLDDSTVKFEIWVGIPIPRVIENEN